MYDTITKQKIDFVVGVSTASYMQSDIREQTDRLGFCSKHLKQIESAQNALGLAIILSTHLDTINKDLHKLLQKDFEVKKSFFGSNKSLSNLNNYLLEYEQNCYLCNLIDKTFDDYINNYFALYKDNDEVVELTKKNHGFCLKHFKLLLLKGNELLTSDLYNSFLKIITKSQYENLLRLQEELNWFIKKFDYRFSEEPWKNSKDVLTRLIKKLD